MTKYKKQTNTSVSLIPKHKRDNQGTGKIPKATRNNCWDPPQKTLVVKLVESLLGSPRRHSDIS